ncbi:MULTISPECIES: nucleoside triphosphate pyrophosphohydrolase [Marinobacter]|jgi:ATP diphosphatase|uniref:nucleoside triphosphate pyrophosphohydrolase n=1 Tax=Marinobacter TaxID=2742 RepID=UPI000EB3CD44|nr:MULTISPECIES: nucleoside triphosphate pyrophosphohydrolase [Marinobacter]MEC8896884.1 nucleoside triphosphate pyrophosphohydrolase [Pseudomonadota bacterium]MBN8240200.1 nucleoside triphosphate pyrophosphohydrolase [Marinobacter nauticus]MCW9009010.1 nucleoside triphosphate pyrophosphohydrolase [Marinobacter sp.]MEC9041172.1 nucleoside triphosphate pyrophosphohydrolase [Pseudomonadota bacterium]MEC9388141.1 nucleoside triphosphate pyrophosphohydrolase [Pseudomonadota bacterium]|tara:strand:- start:8101 stop:8940 length:840 start_codon:yes stop_codon:yes gene_type:complete
MSYSIEDLKHLMARLRDPDTGCPWDTKQTFASIVPHTIEEAYEVADAIEQEDFPHLKDELGDLLFQVIFYARMGEEAGHFEFDGIVDHLVRKLVRRHPHVFPGGTLESRIDPDNRPDEAWIKESWERIKAEERAEKPVANTPASRLDGIARTLPAMARAEKLQRRAARHGFDWPDIGPVFDKLHEEIDELKEAWQMAEAGTGDLDAVEDELGDLLFVCVNLARFLKVNPEQALKRTNHKFDARFRAIERVLEKEGRNLDEETLEALDAVWQSVKGVEKE